MRSVMKRAHHATPHHLSGSWSQRLFDAQAGNAGLCSFFNRLCRIVIEDSSQITSQPELLEMVITELEVDTERKDVVNELTTILNAIDRQIASGVHAPALSELAAAA